MNVVKKLEVYQQQLGSIIILILFYVENKTDWGRYAKIAGASAVAGTAMALTAGLAGPAILGYFI